MVQARYKIFLMLFYIAVCGTVVCSCKKKDNSTDPGKQWLMTVNFKDDYINPKLKAIVFVSDANGNPLADTMVAGNTNVLLYSEKTATPPFQVTIVKWEPDMHNFLVTISTYQNVTPSEWTLQGRRLVSTGEATINLQNVPNHSGPILYSNSGYSNLTFATAGNKHPIYQLPDDLYIKLSSPSGSLYKWTNGIIPGETYDVDLSDMKTAEPHTITFPVATQDFHVKVYGYRDTSYLSLPIAADELIGNGDKVDNVTVSVPPATFSRFRTYIELIESWASPLTYTCSQNDAIPDSFIKLNAAINNINIQGSKTDFNSVGDFTVTSAVWYFHDTENLAFEWTVFGPDTLTTISLPILPPAMKSMFPTLALDSLTFYQFEIINYPKFDSYNAYLENIFNPATSGLADRLNSSSIRVMAP
ncbi:MAG: hypothetical protein WCP32_02845 [Bacteroidota bacterium]